ncbi:MAG: hypothetical protein IJ662_13490 [Clostridia bacterium]|nr:hypothetical protein [Clostridia bacterium]
MLPMTVHEPGHTAVNADAFAGNEAIYSKKYSFHRQDASSAQTSPGTKLKTTEPPSLSSSLIPKIQAPPGFSGGAFFWRQ